MNLAAWADPQIRAWLRDPFWLIPRLYIETGDEGELRPIRRLRAEQVEFVRAFVANPSLLVLLYVLKSRQIGITTIACACFVWLLLNSPDAAKLVQATHEGAAVASLNSKIRIMLMNLPKVLRPALSRDTANLIEMAHNGASFRQWMAGGRSQGRSYSFQHAHFTEMAFYPAGSSAVKGKGVDRQLWGSIRATMRASKRARVVVESTANGPSGLFYDLNDVAYRSKQWTYLFWPWFFTRQYAADRLPDRWELTPEEAELLSLYADQGLTQLHLAGRRQIMEEDGLSAEEFKFSYPSNREEPFLLTGSASFDLQMVNRMIARASAVACPPKQDLVIYERPLEGRLYGIGQDTSGGIGLDWSVIVVVRDDGKVVARWHSNTTRPDGQARVAAELSALYHRAKILVELNRHGKYVFKALCAMGANVWLDEHGKPWWTQGGKNDTRGVLLDWVSELVSQGYFLPADFNEPWVICPLICKELGRMRENPRTGKVEHPEGEHDDHAMAWMLALWCIRRKLRARPRLLWTPEAARQNAAAIALLNRSRP